MFKALWKFLTRPLGIMPFPPGMTADGAPMFGLLGLMANVNAYAEALATVAGTTTTTLVLTAANVLAKNIVMTVGNITGAFTINLPSTKSIFAALGPTVPTDGSFWFPLYIANQGTGQTGTLTAGDASTTVSATGNSIATNISAKWMVQVTGPTTLAITRVFGGTN